MPPPCATGAKTGLAAIASSTLVQLYQTQASGTAATLPAGIQSLNGNPAVSVDVHGSQTSLNHVVHKLEVLGLSLLDIALHAKVVDGDPPIAQLPAAAAPASCIGDYHHRQGDGQ